MRIYYDLARCPPTYDIVSFLCRAEMERISSGDDKIELDILPGPAGGFRRDPLWPFSVDERRAMLHNVALPLCTLLPNVSITLHPDRPAVQGLGVGQRLYGLEEQVSASRAGVRPLRSPYPVKQSSGLIVLTLRECEHWPERNSKVEEWASAARTLQARGYRVVIVRDTLRADESIAGVTTSPAASRNLYCRADLYTQAELNVFVSNGPAWMCWAMDRPTLVFKRPADGALGRAFGPEHFRNCGMPWGGQMPGAPDYQRIVWKDDTAENIVNAVDLFMVPSIYEMAEAG